MGKLSHIEDVEQRNAAREQEQMQAAQEALLSARAHEVASAQEAVRPDMSSTPEAAGTPEALDSSAPRDNLTAQQEEDFHGLSSVESMGAGQKILIVLAVMVVIAAVLYILNSWFHFA